MDAVSTFSDVEDAGDVHCRKFLKGVNGFGSPWFSGVASNIPTAVKIIS